jgi:hypothetical protein
MLPRSPTLQSHCSQVKVHRTSIHDKRVNRRKCERRTDGTLGRRKTAVIIIIRPHFVAKAHQGIIEVEHEDNHTTVEASQ